MVHDLLEDFLIAYVPRRLALILSLFLAYISRRCALLASSLALAASAASGSFSNRLIPPQLKSGYQDNQAADGGRGVAPWPAGDFGGPNFFSQFLLILFYSALIYNVISDFKPEAGIR